MVDTSSEYIKMCEKAEEIQAIQTKILPLTKGNWFVMKSDHEVVIVRDGAMMVISPAIPFIWLPRQDQLQEMLHPEAVFHLLEVEYLSRSMLHASLEQVWLAWVMKSKFGKCWNTEDWVKGD